jgi:hypothetical protein
MLRMLRVEVAAAALVGLAAGAGGGLVLADALGGPLLAPAEKAAKLQRLALVATTDSNTESAATPASARLPIPAQMLGSDVPVPISPAVLRVRNGWLVSDGKTLVAVYVGAAGDDSSEGRVVIVRQNLVAGRQTVRTLDAGSTGGLTIESAPLGKAVETSAQTGALRLLTGEARLLTLDLGSETVSQDAHETPLP